MNRQHERWHRRTQYWRDNGHRISVPFRSAHHESAHAAASIYGLRSTRSEADLPSPLVDCVRIYRIRSPLPGRVEDGRFWTGSCHGPWVYDLKNEAQPQPDKRAALEWDLVATIAGSVAEAVYCCLRGVDKIEDFARNMGGGGRDFRRVDLLMAELRLMTNGRRRVVRPFVKRTIDFLEEHWHEVEALARVLAKEKKIEGDRIAEIVDAAALCNRTGRMPAI